jgi:hypothetical protein
MTEEIIVDEDTTAGGMTQEQLAHGPVVEVLEPEVREYSFSEYTHTISEDLVVTVYADGIVVDKSGPFDTQENAEVFATSIVDALTAGDIKPNHAFMQG